MGVGEPTPRQPPGQARKDRDRSRAHRTADGRGCQHCHTARILAPGSSVCSSGDEDGQTATGWPDKSSCKRLGVLTPVCRLFCQEGQRTRESPCDVGWGLGKNAMTAADRRVLALGPAPRQGNTDKVLEWRQGGQGRPRSWAPGPTQVQREAGRPNSGHGAWELTGVPLYTGQPPRSSLFSLDSTVPKNK